MATSKAYLAAPETAITFTASGGDVIATFDGLLTLAGRQSAQHDFTDSARAFMYRWRANTQWDTQPIVGETLDFYYKSALTASTVLDNDDGTGDIALSAADKLKNLHYIGSIVVDEAILDIPTVASGTIAIYERFIHIVAFNNSVDTLSTTANHTSFTLTPISIQGQAT
tara:strand:+ start:27 stop:533 length:507 start_codon:yes stop_codon:yes gene_type:complete